MFDRYYNELEVGEHRSFPSVTITESHIVTFAGVTGDNYGLHMDAEYAKSTPFGQRVAHGLLVLSCGAGLIPLEPGRVQALLGLDQVRWLLPVVIGDTIHPEMEVMAKRDKGNGGIVTLQEEIKNQRGEIVCTCRVEALVSRRPIEGV